MVNGLVIPAVMGQAVEQRKFAMLEDYQAAVGGWIEAVDLPALGVTIYVNEEGLVRQMPFNSRASFLWWYHVPEARQRAMLVGDAVLVGKPDRNGDSTDLPGDVGKLLLATSTTEFRVELLAVGDDSTWRHTRAVYPDYWEAIVWAMVLLERSSGIENVRVVPIELR